MINVIRKLLDSGFGTAVTILGCVAGWIIAVSLDWRLWPLVAVFVALLALAVFAHVTRRDIPVSGRIVENQTAREAIDYAFSNISYPICRVGVVSHAAGIAAVGAATRNVAAELARLLAVVNNQTEELTRESDFSAKSLVCHRTRVARLCATLDSLAKAWDSAKLTVLPEGRAVLRDLLRSARLLERNVLEEVDGLLDEFPKTMGWDEQGDRPWHRRVHTALNAVVRKALVAVSDPDWIPTMIKEIEAILDKLKKDWNDDVKEVHTRPGCKPRG